MLGLCLFFSHCRKNRYEATPKDIGKSYFPIDIGVTWIYKADSVIYGFTGVKEGGDTSSFYIKELVTFKIKDSLKTTYTVSRYQSKDTLNWSFVKNHFYEVENWRIHHKENNLITTPLVFPVARYYYWNGNELNNMGPKEYEYSIADFEFKLNDLTFPRSLKVKIDSIDNLRERKINHLIFGKDIGPVYSESTDLLLINNDSLDKKGNIVIRRPPKIEKGIIFKKVLISHE